MKKNLLIALITVAVALLCAGVGTSTLTLVPQFNLRLVESIVCSDGQTLEYQESATYTYTDSTGTHRRANIAIECVASDGSRFPGKEGATIGTLMGLYFLTCFVPLLAVGLFLRWKFLRPTTRTSA